MKNFSTRQEQLHKEAIRLLKQIDECRSFFAFDPAYMRMMIEQYKKQYAEIMMQLIEPVLETLEDDIRHISEFLPEIDDQCRPRMVVSASGRIDCVTIAEEVLK